jgi:hypothetical protein
VEALGAEEGRKVGVLKELGWWKGEGRRAGRHAEEEWRWLAGEERRGEERRGELTASL